MYANYCGADREHVQFCARCIRLEPETFEMVFRIDEALFDSAPRAISAVGDPLTERVMLHRDARGAP